MADVITTLLPLRVILADVIAMMSWCYVTTNVDVCLADVIAKWQMEWPLQGWSGGRCYCHVADGMATGSSYFNLSSEVLNRTLSHI